MNYSLTLEVRDIIDKAIKEGYNTNQLIPLLSSAVGAKAYNPSFVEEVADYAEITSEREIYKAKTKVDKNLPYIPGPPRKKKSDKVDGTSTRPKNDVEGNGNKVIRGRI